MKGSVKEKNIKAYEKPITFIGLALCGARLTLCSWLFSYAYFFSLPCGGLVYQDKGTAYEANALWYRVGNPVRAGNKERS